ncbi:hypothetical protein OXX79_007207, partial [Metschnikowia pulcherrima]
MSNCRVKI